MNRTIVLNGRPVAYMLIRKQVRNINIRVRADGTIGVSAGQQVSIDQVEQALHRKSAFLLNTLDRFAKRAERIPSEQAYGEGEKMWLLGSPYVIAIVQGRRNQVEMKGNTLRLTLRDPLAVELRKKTVDIFLSEKCLEVTTALSRVAYSRLQSLGVPMPEIRVRSMTSRWGSCQPLKGKITFARQLIEAPLSCVEYVVWHEMIHFLHPNHSKAFYGCLAQFVPDWSTQRALLNSYGYR